MRYFGNRNYLHPHWGPIDVSTHPKLCSPIGCVCVCTVLVAYLYTAKILKI